MLDPESVLFCLNLFFLIGFTHHLPPQKKVLCAHAGELVKPEPYRQENKNNPSCQRVGKAAVDILCSSPDCIVLWTWEHSFDFTCFVLKNFFTVVKVAKSYHQNNF